MQPYYQIVLKMVVVIAETRTFSPRLRCITVYKTDLCENVNLYCNMSNLDVENV